MSIFKTLGRAIGVDKPATGNISTAPLGAGYDEAMAGLKAAGMGGKLPDIRSGLESTALSDLQGLSGKKNMFDTLDEQAAARLASANMQNTARSLGGTGNLASMANAGLANIHDKSVEDLLANRKGNEQLRQQALAGISGQYGNLYGQDFNKASAMGNLAVGKGNAMYGAESQNAMNEANAQDAQAGRLMGTIGTVAGIAGGASSPHTFMNKAFGAKPRV